MTVDNRPVGFFDSGLGGISVLGEALRVLPEENFVYFGDTKHIPYGDKPPEMVFQYTHDAIERLVNLGCKAIVIACNTATSVAAGQLRQELKLPIIGMEPALKPAHELRKDGQILVLATPMTLKLPKFLRLMELYGEGACPLPCPGLMDLVEREDFTQARRYLEELLSPFDLADVDAVVLGCTHYSFLRPVLAELLPEEVPVLDGNQGTARQLARVLEERGLNRLEGEGSFQLETSGDPAVAIPIMERLLARA